MQDIASSISFALASKPPTLPSPSNPYLRWLRSFSVIKSITLLISESTLNIRPHTAPPHRFTWSLYFRGIAYHLSRLVLSYLITDLATYPLWRLAPHTFGSPPMQQRDFHAWCAALSAQYGGPSWAWWVFWTWCLVIVTGSIVAMLPHLSALVFITIGFASPKEFPMVMHGPLLSSSFNEFWGKRYHQVSQALGRRDAGSTDLWPAASGKRSQGTPGGLAADTGSHSSEPRPRRSPRRQSLST